MMASLVDIRFSAWTAGLDPVAARIAIFSHIRDFPYSLKTRMDDPARAPEQLLVLGRGYCGPKHLLLARMYRRLELDVTFAIVPFLWDNPELRYPPELRRLAAAMPSSSHLACRVRIDDRWVLVDATWDPPLKKGGFPVNESWDGFADMLCAVKPLRKTGRNPRDVCPGNPVDCGRDTHPGRDSAVSPRYDPTQVSRFHHELETWLRSLRGESPSDPEP